MLFEDNSLSIGNTPLVRINNITRGFPATVLAKIEGRNPAYSVKCRIAASMIWDAEKKGILTPGSRAVTIVEPTSGNTGIGLAFVCAARGYPLVLTMPDTMSIERRRMLAAFGAQLILTEGAKGMKGAIEEAERLVATDPKKFFSPQQFKNPANPEIHYKTTGPEIFNDTQGKIDIFVAGVGTGGTVSGVGRYLKEKNPAVQIVAVEPDASPMLSEGHAGPHGLQGIGANFVPDNFDRSVIDEIIRVKEADAYRSGKLLAKSEGFLVGITSGAALWAAEQLARREENRGKNIVALLPDTGERYLSTPLFAE